MHGTVFAYVNSNRQTNVEEICGGESRQVGARSFAYRARSERGRLLSVTKNAERLEPFEELLADSLSNFHIAKASLKPDR
jgi:hypothetical protein